MAWVLFILLAAMIWAIKLELPAIKRESNLLDSVDDEFPRTPAPPLPRPLPPAHYQLNDGYVPIPDDADNTTRCRDLDKFPVYFYRPHTLAGTTAHERFSPNYWQSAMLRTPGINITDDPNEACLLIPNMTTQCPLNICPEDFVKLELALPTLPFWDSGRGHIVFGDSDWVDVLPGAAIMAHGGTDASRHRFGLDVAFPLMPNGAPPLHHEPGSPRRHTLTFSGTVIVGWVCFEEVRSRLWVLHDPPASVVLTHCGGDSAAVDAEAGCRYAQNESDYYARGHNAAYEELMNTTFGLAPRGCGPSSYRVIELIQMGIIPVIMQDDSVLPFAELIDWSELSILVPERSIRSIPTMLASIRPKKVRRMQDRLAAVHRMYFRSQATVVETLVRVLKRQARARIGSRVT